jgi:hypothetical protein
MPASRKSSTYLPRRDAEILAFLCAFAAPPERRACLTRSTMGGMIPLLMTRRSAPRMMSAVEVRMYPTPRSIAPVIVRWLSWPTESRRRRNEPLISRQQLTPGPA